MADGVLEFRVQGSMPQPYCVRFARVGERVTATCDCEAGLIGALCKHRRRLLAGEIEGVVEGGSELGALALLIVGSALATAVAALDAAEAAVAAAKREVGARKRALARIMTGSS